MTLLYGNILATTVMIDCIQSQQDFRSENKEKLQTSSLLYFVTILTEIIYIVASDLQIVKVQLIWVIFKPLP